MDVSKIQTETVNLLSDITGLKISQKDINPTILFLSALVSVLLGVIYVDQQVTDEEIQRLKITLRQFIPNKGNMAQLVKLMVKGIRKQKTYQNINDLLLLTAPFSESENLLLISLGYEMSAADGSMDIREKQYLEIIAKHLKIETKHLNTLESAFGGAVSITKEDIEKIKFLLDPVWFHDLDSVFVKAASQILKIFPENTDKKQSQQSAIVRYKGLQAFQEYKIQLDKKCFTLNQIVQECINKEFLQDSLIQEIDKVSKKLQSQKFRVAVVGEFSKGKSTILNALLGENIQPVRSIPCSGAVTVLRYGSQKRVICCYKDQRQEEISLDQYHEKAAISEAAAMGSCTEELANSEISEIVFEHPNLALCQYGVEIVDSPGLNEHPARTEITQTLLKDTDAVIFVTNASQLLSETERKLLQDLKNQLNGGKEDKPANNLFMLVNCWDLIRTETERNLVKKRAENLVIEQNPIIAGSNRIHYISAQQTLDAVLGHSANAQSKGTENEYVHSFSQFTQSLENFLTQERGILEVTRATDAVNQLVQSGLEGLEQTENLLTGKLKLSEAAKQEIIEQVGEISGRKVKLVNFADQQLDEALEATVNLWNRWVDELGERLFQASQTWHSRYSPFDDKKKLIKDYGKQFEDSIQKELQQWIERLKRDVLQDQLTPIIQNELEAVKNNLIKLDGELNINVGKQFTSAMSGNMNANELSINPDLKSCHTAEEEGFNLFGGLGIGGLTGAALLGFTGLGFLPIALIAGVAGFIGSFFGGPSEEELHEEIRQEVYDAGCDKFLESQQEIFDKICAQIESMYESRIKLACNLMNQAISMCDNLMKQEEKAHQESLEQQQQDKIWIEQKRQKLGQVQHEIDSIVEKVKVS
ncbi:MAG: dynamin family protein [Microcoleaceae cyanobacterium]